MAPSGNGFAPPPDAAAKSALRREPIILQGFDRSRQLDIQFRTIPFGAIWLRRAYTNDRHRHIAQRTKADELRLQEVRYGNNITVLLKACFQVRQYYDTCDFWPAIAKGFGASADVVRDMVELLIDARYIYLRESPVALDIAPSGANIAADRWRSFLANRRSGTGAVEWSTKSPREPLVVYTHANAFFADSEGKQVDLAHVLPKRVEYQHYSPLTSRKREASPEPLGSSPSPKRRTSCNYLDRNEPLPLPPLSTNIQIKGSAKQNYQTPISASESSHQVDSFDHSSPNEATEVFRRIRGTAAQNSNGLPPIANGDSISKQTLPSSARDEENQRLRDRVTMLEKELSNVKSRLSNDHNIRIMVQKVLSESSLVAGSGTPSNLDPALKSMQARIASLERSVADGAAHHEQEIKDVKNQIITLKDSLTKDEEAPNSQDGSFNSTLHVSVTGTSEDKSQVGPRDKAGEIAGLEGEFTPIDPSTDEGKYVHELAIRVAAIEKQQDRDKESHVTKDFVQVTVKELDGCLAPDRESNSEQLRFILQRLTTVEGQSARLAESIDKARTPKSPSPSRDMQRRMDIMFETMDSLPTEASVTEMIMKHEQVLKSKDENLRKIMDDMSTKINGLPAMADVSKRIMWLESGLRAELERCQRDTYELVDGTRKDFETLQAQVKCLNKLWNEATTGIADSDSLLALKVELDALKGDLAIQSRGLRISNQDAVKSRDNITAKLESRIREQSAQFHTALSRVTPVDFSTRIQEVHSRIDTLQSSTGQGDARVNALVMDIETLYKRISMLAKALNEIGHFMGPA